LKCRICGVRRPRRYCPGVNGDICSICCGTQREVTVRCPYSCVLQEARTHERVEPLDPKTLPNRDIVVRERFIAEHAEQMTAVTEVLAAAVLRVEGAADADARDALEALIRTYRTLSSGLYYDTRPENAIAARMFDAFQDGMKERRRVMQQEGAAFPIDSEVLVMLAFLQRVAIDRDNGRPLCRAFLQEIEESLNSPSRAPAQQGPSLIHLA